MDKMLTIRIGEETQNRLKALAATAGTTVSTVARALIENPRAQQEGNALSEELLSGIADLIEEQQKQLDRLSQQVEEFVHENTETNSGIDMICAALESLTNSVNKHLGAKVEAAADVLEKMVLAKKRQDWVPETGPGGRIGKFSGDGVVVLKSEDDQAMILVSPDGKVVQTVGSKVAIAALLTRYKSESRS